MITETVLVAAAAMPASGVMLTLRWWLNRVF
jgi:hypothetical protein